MRPVNPIKYLQYSQCTPSKGVTNYKLIIICFCLITVGEKRSTIMKILNQELKKTFRENIKMEVIYTSTELGFQLNIKDPIPKRHNYDIIYHAVCPEDNYNEDYIDECARRLEERTKDYNGRGKNSRMLSNSIQSGHNGVSESDLSK